MLNQKKKKKPMIYKYVLERKVQNEIQTSRR
jgi:hypothetical protein